MKNELTNNNQMIEDEKIISINKRSFITVCLILISFMILAYILTFILPSGVYTNTIYSEVTKPDYNLLKFITSPIRLLGSSDGLSVIVISLFILILAGSFNVMNQTKGIDSIIGYLIHKFKNNRYRLMCIVTLTFMLFGSFFGIFEESITLLPIIILLSLSLGWDTFTGLGMCLLAAGFGFSTAITNPFSVGLGSSKMGINLTDGIWYRILIFILMYTILCLFLYRHIKKIEKDPLKSPTYESDNLKKIKIANKKFDEYNPVILRVYSFFFLILLIIIVLSSSLKDLQGLSIPIIALVFLIGTFVCGLLIKERIGNITKMFLSGVKSISPSIIMLLLAGSIKFILDETLLMDTIIYEITSLFKSTSPIIGLLFIYLLVLIIQIFIGSASAKIILIVPIISVIAKNLEISQNLALLSFIFGDGYTDVIYPTNPVLLIGLGMAGFSYIKWIKHTFLLQLLVLAITIGLLILGYYIGY